MKGKNVMTNYEKAVEIYNKAGQYAVYRACQTLELDHDAWLRCEPCEDLTPHSDGTCLVCGTLYEYSNCAICGEEGWCKHDL